MEYPQGYGDEGHAQCLVLDEIPSDMKIVPDSDCEQEFDSAGRRLGNSHRLAVYLGSVTYYIGDAGTTCASEGDVIRSLKECQLAAAALNLDMSEGFWSDDYGKVPQ